MNSNSGVAFSPPSIVKDALGDSGMLLHRDITDSPELSQVHNINKLMNKIENKLMIQRDTGNQQQQHFEPHSHGQPHGMNNIISIIDNKSAHIEKTSIAYSNLGNQTNTHSQIIQKTLPSITSIRGIGNGACSKVNMIVKGLPAQSHFNPYADENDSTSKFQLSKSIGSYATNSSSLGVETSNLSSRILSRSRFFGNDRTNLMPIDRQISNRLSNGINLRRENFYTFNITNNTIRKTSSTYTGTHEHSSNSQLMQENPVMFRNYDLNDEYWLNFE